MTAVLYFPALAHPKRSYDQMHAEELATLRFVNPTVSWNPTQSQCGIMGVRSSIPMAIVSGTQTTYEI